MNKNMYPHPLPKDSYSYPLRILIRFVFLPAIKICILYSSYKDSYSYPLPPVLPRQMPLLIPVVPHWTGADPHVHGLAPVQLQPATCSYILS